MSNFIIDPTTISQDAIKAALLAWVESQPGFDAWSKFYESTSGKAFIDMSSGMMAFLKYDSMMARRESYFQYAQNRSSVIAGGQFLGYSAFRGRNAILSVTFTPSSSGALTKWQEIGLVKSLSMLVITPVAYTSGVPITVQVILGNIVSQTLTAPNANLNAFHFTTPKVSDDLRIYVDSVEVATSNSITDLLNGAFEVQTNPFGSVDAKYLNLSTFTTQYAAGSLVELQWLELNNLSFDLSDIAFNSTLGALNSSLIVSLYADVESTVSIQVNAPLENETKDAVRSRKDMQKTYKKLNPTFVDAKGTDVSAAIIKVFGLPTPNYLRLNVAEKIVAQAAFTPYRMNGLQPPLIGDPSEASIALAFAVVLNTNIVGDLEAAVDAVLLGYKDKLGGEDGVVLNLVDMEDVLTSKDFIRKTRVRLTGPTWGAADFYPRGSLVSPPISNGFIYKVMSILYKTGVSEPTWPLVAGNAVRDGFVQWTAVANTNLAGIPDWVASTVQTLDAVVKPLIANGFTYVCTKVFNDSGVAEPTWSPLGGGQPAAIAGTKTVDNQIIWVARPLVGTPAAWVASTDYLVGDLVVATNPTTSDTVGVMFQAFGFRGKSGAVIPVFPTTVDLTVDDGGIRWSTVDPYAEKFLLEADQYFTITRTITTS